MAEAQRLTGRAGEMARSLRAALQATDVAEREVDGVMRAHALAMGSRTATLDDDHHPAYLHPGRSPLILLHDVGAVDTAVLIVATIHESEDDGLRVSATELEERLGASARDAVAALPLPGDEGLVERLVTLGPGASLAVLAERLDQLRHLHLRDDLVDRWADHHREVAGAWLPFAQRVHPRLATRFAHWARTFAKRLGGP